MQPIFFEPAPIRRLWDELEGCRRCLHDRKLTKLLDADTYTTYRVPGILPSGAKRATYVIVAMEPSGGRSSRRRMRERERAGYRNLYGSPEDLSLCYAIEHWLIRRGEGYYLTDMGKCAMPVKYAARTRERRFDLCFAHFAAEIALLQPCAIIAVGGVTFRALHERRLPGWPPIFSILHFSRQAAGHRRRYLHGRWQKRVPSLNRLKRWVESRRVAPSKRRRSREVVKGHLQLLGVYRAQFKAVREVLTTARFAARGDIGVRVSLGTSRAAINAKMPARAVRLVARLRARTRR